MPCRRAVTAVAHPRPPGGSNGTVMRLGIASLFLLIGCAHVAPAQPRAEVLLSVQNVTGHDVCAVHLWNEDESFKSVENKLLPGAQLLEPDSAFRLHAGSRRDFTVPAVAPLRLEAVDCEGHLLDSRELRVRAGTIVSLALVEPSRG
jgi:hypothetical protein